jgi:hypothetical protein
MIVEELTTVELALMLAEMNREYLALMLAVNNGE